MRWLPASTPWLPYGVHNDFTGWTGHGPAYLAVRRREALDEQDAERCLQLVLSWL